MKRVVCAHGLTIALVGCAISGAARAQDAYSQVEYSQVDNGVRTPNDFASRLRTPINQPSDFQTLLAGPGFVQVDPLIVIPTVGLSAGRTSNLTAAKDNAISTPYVSLAPSVTTFTRNGLFALMSGYNGYYTRYTQSAIDNTNNHTLFASFVYKPTYSTDWKGNVTLTRGADSRGGGVTQVNASPNEFNQASLRTTLAYGGLESTARTEMELSYIDRKYQNNRDTNNVDVIFGTRALDVGILSLTPRFSLKVAPSTRTFFEYQHVKTDYRDSATLLDNTDHRAFVGVRWDGDTRLQGIAKLGVNRKVYAPETGRDTKRGNLVDIRGTYAPRTYSVIDVYFNRTLADPTGFTQNYLVAGAGVNWRYDWTSQISTRVSFGQFGEFYEQFNGGSDRDDRTSTTSVSVKYKANRWMGLEGVLAHSNRSSNQSVFEYSRNIVQFNVLTTL